MDIQWFPGHMTKTKRLIKENIKKIDVVIEILDARAPLASRNPLIEEMTGHKPRVIILNKEDLADPRETDRWMKHFKGKETLPLKISCSRKKGLDRIPKAARSVCRKQNPNASIRVMVVGIPNVGKSTLINALVKKKKAAVGNTPGLTRGIQLINLPGNIQLIDTPGILWHKFEDQIVGQRLAIIGTIKTTILPQLELAKAAFEIFKERYPDLISTRFKLETFPTSWELLLEEIGRKRGCLIKGGAVDLEKAAVQFLRDIREGKVGRFTLETLEASPVSEKKEEENS